MRYHCNILKAFLNIASAEKEAQSLVTVQSTQNTQCPQLYAPNGEMLDPNVHTVPERL